MYSNTWGWSHQPGDRLYFKLKATLIQTHGVPDLSILVDLLDSLQMFPTSVSRNVAGDLFVEMHDHSLVFMQMNDVLQFIMHEE